MKLVCISDTHGKHRELLVPDGDLLICTGDISLHGEERIVRDFDAWLGELPHRHKLLIAGNHDFNFESRPESRAWIRNAIYLQDEGATVAGLRVWGSPWSPRFFDWAFNVDRGEPSRRIWERIPPGTELLLTHGPPFGVLDRTARGEAVGCEELRKAVARLRPRVHVFGHIHEDPGVLEEDGTLFVNASSCDLRYKATQAPIVVEI